MHRSEPRSASSREMTGRSSSSSSPCPRASRTSRCGRRTPGGPSGSRNSCGDRSRVWATSSPCDDIQRSRPVELSDVVRRYLPFTSWEAFYDPYAPEAWGSPRYGSFMTAGRGGAPGSAAGGCPPSVSVNGVRPMGGWAVNDFRPEDVEAIEVYRKSYQLPMEFSGWSVGCGGLVVVWLR